VPLCLYRRHPVALHAFIKKARTTPDEEFGIGAQASERVGTMSKKHMGSSINDFLKEEGIFEEAQVQPSRKSSPGSSPKP